MANPFEDENGVYTALINDEGQYSLWPAAIDLSQGWTVAFGPAPRPDCLEFVNATWTDMRPRSLAVQMDSRDQTSR